MRGGVSVFIHEAILARSKERPYITRKSWAYITNEPVKAPIKVLPTNTPDCCVIMHANGRKPCRGWQPQAEDLVANDWVAI